MALSIDWPTRVIHVPQSFLTLLGGTLYELDTEQFRRGLKDLEDDEVGMAYPDTHRRNAPVLLGGIEYAQTIEIINGYTVTFEETGSPYAVTITGSNNNILEVTNLGTVQLLSNNSAGLIQTREIQYASFAGGVTLDETSSTEGTIYPAGTRRAPVNNLADAMLIANLYGFNVIYIVGDATIDSGGNHDEMIFVGQGWEKSNVTVSAAASVYRCEFRDMHVTGTLDGQSRLRNCRLTDLNYVSGEVEQCLLDPGTITLGGGAVAHFLECWSGVPGQSTPTIDLGGAGQALGMRAYSGGIQLTNKAGPEAVSIDLISGQIKLDSSVTGGTIVCRGDGKLTDNSAGATVADELTNGLEIRQRLDFLAAAEGGNWRIIGTQMIFYDAADAELMRFNLLDASNNPTATNPTQRVRV